MSHHGNNPEQEKAMSEAMRAGVGAGVNYLPLSIEQDCDLGVVTIEGIRYSFHLFQGFWSCEVGQVLRIDKRDDGVLTFTRVDKP